MTPVVTDADRAKAREFAHLFGGNGLNENAQVELVAVAIAEMRGPQPSGIEAEVCADITRRQAHGIAKYGQTVAANPLEDWLQHAYEEALDFAVYLRRAMAEVKAGRANLPRFKESCV